jgi:hypothetical protein
MIGVVSVIFAVMLAGATLAGLATDDGAYCAQNC